MWRARDTIGCFVLFARLFLLGARIDADEKETLMDRSATLVFSHPEHLSLAK
jgi:hypothetical protein